MIIMSTSCMNQLLGLNCLAQRRRWDIHDLPCQYWRGAFDCLGQINIGHGNHLPHLARVMFI